MKRDIEWLLFESEISIYEISKATGISQQTLYKYTNKISDIKNMTFGNALKLHKYYKNNLKNNDN